MVFQLLQVLARKYGLHFFRQLFGVVIADAKGNDGAHIPKNGVFYAIRQLVKVLVGNVQIKPVFAGFREDGRENVR